MPKHFRDARLQRCSMQAIKMTLMPKVLSGGQLDVDTLCLENHANLSSQIIRVTSYIKTHNRSVSAYWNHQRGEDAKQRGLTAAVGSKQSEKFGVTNVEGCAIESSALAITMHDILHRDDGRFGRGFGIRTSDSQWSFGGHRLFYDEMLSCGSCSDGFSSLAWKPLLK